MQTNNFKEYLGEGINLEMVYIPSGTFMMGSPSTERDKRDTEVPQHQVTVNSFFMGKYPVTQAQWLMVASLPKLEYDLNLEPSNFKGDNRPVETVSWYDAVEFCWRLSRKTGKKYRLPFEAEWEYACRAITAKEQEYTPFYFGTFITPELANYNGHYIYGDGVEGVYRAQTTEVGSFPPNAFGLYDMHGNVWEWCHDNWHHNYNGAPTDGSSWLHHPISDTSVLRGGSWRTEPTVCRSAFRTYSFRQVPDNSYGFLEPLRAIN